MAAGRRILLLFLVLLFFAKARSNSYIICNNTGITSNLYTRREGSNYCYRLFQSITDFSLANRTCVRQNGYLVKIESEEENSYIMSEFFMPTGQQFWIGLTDIDDEGVFRWVKDNTLASGTYSNWTGGSPVGSNAETFDCVKFTADGWSVQQSFCDSTYLSYLCKQEVCESEDGLTCYKPPIVTSSSVSPVIIAVVVVIVVILIIVIVVTIFLVWLWKYRNDAFYRYILCCVYGGSKTQINNLKQENIRLRKELSQQKLNLNSSGRFPQGQLSHQNSQAGMVSPKPPLSPEPSRMSLSKSFSFGSNKVSPSGGMISPQMSGSFLPPGNRMGRSISNASGFSFGSQVKSPPNFSTRPSLPAFKNAIPSISEEVFPTGDNKPSQRPTSAQSNSSGSSSSTSSENTDDKKTKEKPTDATTSDDTKEPATVAEDTKQEPS